jgi:hypothetical protein
MTAEVRPEASSPDLRGVTSSTAVLMTAAPGFECLLRHLRRDLLPDGAQPGLKILRAADLAAHPASH